MPRKISSCVLDNPRGDSISLGDKWICLSAISRTQSIDMSHLSKVINGKREATLSTYLKIANAIDMGLEELLAAIHQRKKAIDKHHIEVVEGYVQRVAEEGQVAQKIRNKKRPVPPSLPLTHVSDEDFKEAKKLLRKIS